MTRRPGAPMPESIRHMLRAKHHPARAVPCPHCGASEFRPCRSQSRARVLPEPHPSRVGVWARTVAECPVCEAGRGVPCLSGGRPLPDSAVHRERETAAGADGGSGVA